MNTHTLEFMMFISGLLTPFSLSFFFFFSKCVLCVCAHGSVHTYGICVWRPEVDRCLTQPLSFRPGLSMNLELDNFTKLHDHQALGILLSLHPLS